MTDDTKNIDSLLTLPQRQMNALIRLAFNNTLDNCLKECVINWHSVYAEAIKQAVVGIVFAGIEKMPKEKMPSMDILMDWLGRVEYIKTQNLDLSEKCILIQRFFRHAGYNTCILKGQGIANLYGNLSTLRNPGDIDLWIDCKRSEAIDFTQKTYPTKEFNNKHISYRFFSDVEVELHWYPSISYNPIYRRRLLKFYNEIRDSQFGNSVTIQSEGISHSIIVPDLFFCRVNSMLHLYDHYLYEGIGLRQILDYYFILKASGENKLFWTQQKIETIQRLEEFGISKFAGAVMYVLKEVVHIDDLFLITEPDEREGRILLKEIIEGGNFGQSSTDNRIVGESFIHRMYRRARRKIRFFRYDPLGVICIPFYKCSELLYKRCVYMKYGL